MPHGHRDREIIRKQRFVEELPVHGRVAEDGDVDLGLLQPTQRFAGVVDAHLHGGVGMGQGQGLGQAHGVDRRVRADADRKGAGVDIVAEQFVDLLGGGEHAPGQGEQLAPHRGQPERWAAALEQDSLVTVLQGLDLLGKGRLGHIQPAGGPAETALRRNRMKSA